MTPEVLKYYKVLQPVFEKVMGEWKTGDRMQRKCTVFGKEIDAKIWPESKMFEIITIHRQSSVEAYWHCQNEDGEERILTDQDMLSETCIRLPLPIDSENPERSLLGMITHVYGLHFNGEYFVVTAYSGEFDADTPPLALLKALAWQERVVV